MFVTLRTLIDAGNLIAWTLSDCFEVGSIESWLHADSKNDNDHIYKSCFRLNPFPKSEGDHTIYDCVLSHSVYYGSYGIVSIDICRIGILSLNGIAQNL